MGYKSKLNNSKKKRFITDKAIKILQSSFFCVGHILIKYICYKINKWRSYFNVSNLSIYFLFNKFSLQNLYVNISKTIAITYFLHLNYISMPTVIIIITKE